VTDNELINRYHQCQEYMSEYCAWNLQGICMYPVVYGKQPDMDDDGCYAYLDNGMI